MPQNTNLNVSPYFDDFDSKKGYQKVLFKPGTSIQSRELTTLQSILQNQIERFGQHFFKEGSVVIPGQIGYDSDYTCVKIDDAHFGIPVSSYIDKFVGVLIKGEISGVVAKVENYLLNSESEEGVYTLYVKYQSSSNVDFNAKTFIDGENLISLNDVDYALSTIRANTSFATTLISNSISVGSAAKIEEGVYFVRGYFCTVEKQTVILDQYTNTPSYRVGLLVSEEIAVASNNYDDLYDNARGFSNFSAPGADRFKISLSLIKKSVDDFSDDNFIELMRVNNGLLEKFVSDSEYSSIINEFAKRTKDESGDYYIKPFSVSLKNSLNDLIGNNGIYSNSEFTKNGKNPSDDLSCLLISPGKAYVSGYEVETISTNILDVEKPRTTERKLNESLPFNLGRKIEINNVFGSLPVGFGTTSQVSLYDRRTRTVGVSSGTQIGVARVYDLKLKNSEYSNSATKFEISLYDVQTYTTITLNTQITLPTPAYIEGNNSGASGYLVSSVSSSTSLNLYQVSGSFYVGEQIIINGVSNGRTIASVFDYNLSDVHQIVSNNAVSGLGTFSADPILNNIKILSNNASVSSAGTVYSSVENFAYGLRIGDIISYTKSLSSVPTYNRVISIDSGLKRFNVEATNTITNVCDGTLPSSTITVSDLSKVSLNILNSSNSYLYVNLNNDNISNIDLSDSNVVFKKSYVIDIVSNGYNTPLETDQNLVLEPFDEEDYNLTYNSTGVVESLTDQKVSVSGRTITLSNLSVSSGKATLTVSWKKINTKTRKKIYNRSNNIIISNSIYTSSGIGNTTLNDGLTYSTAYGTRVQDREISLNVPDVESVIDVIESSSTQDPQLPYITLINFNSNLSNVVKGEKIVSENSSVAVVVDVIPSSNRIDFVYLNENVFSVGETIKFEESQIEATIDSYTLGDRSIKNSFLFDDGQRSEYLDFSRLIRKKESSFPTRKIRIIFNNYTISSSDEGDFVSVNSYDKERYSSNISSVDGISLTDVIDIRPRVSSYSGSRSPFEFSSRSFVGLTNSSERIFAPNKNTILSYDYYLPRIDKVFLNKDGSFILNKGVPSLSPLPPNESDLGLEIATLYFPAYLYDVNDVKISFSNHKRYTMKDISRLEERISNIEYYTSLSLLESETQNLTINDEKTQLNKFKCGFFVDNFKSWNSGDITNLDYKSSIDVANGILRPQHNTTLIDLVLGSEALVGINQEPNPSVDLRYVKDLGSPNIKKTGDVISLDYSDKIYQSNTFATRVENVNPLHSQNWVGSLELNPSSDTWAHQNQPLKITEGNSDLNLDSDLEGFSPLIWNSWQTYWTGSNESISGPSLANLKTGTTSTLHTRKGNSTRSNTIGIKNYSSISNKDNQINFSGESATLNTSQSRQGIQFGISDRDTYSNGSNIVSRTVETIMRSRNIELVSRRLKPNTRFYAFFDNTNVNSYIIPKLLEVKMTSGTFSAGETVSGSYGNKEIRFRLASQNHKFGPYNNPTEVYTVNPYNTSSSLSSSYSSTTTILNVDTASLESQLISEFYGLCVVNMRLVGETSNATATITNLRIISDSNGDFIGSFYIPDPSLPSTPTFSTGSKTFILTTSQTNSQINPTSESSSESIFTSGGFLSNNLDPSLSLRKSDVQRTSSYENTFTTRIAEQSRWANPLAQIFEVEDPNGVCITKCDVYFKTKDTNNIPIALQIRDVQSNVPSQFVLPFAEKVLAPSNIQTSNNSSIPTTFTFDSPVFLENGKRYAIVLLSPSNEYTVWISRISERDVNSSSIVSQQPVLGSLYKSQNGGNWSPSPLDDLKFTLHRAEFTTNPATVRFYNPNLGIGNNQYSSLQQNSIITYSKTDLVGLGKSLTNSDILLLNQGNTITQNNNSYFSGKLRQVGGSVGIGSTSLTITSSGVGFTGGPYTNVDLISLTGFGRGAKATIYTSNGFVAIASVTSGGIGYQTGDTLSISNVSQTGGFGKNLIVTINSNAGSISSYNSLIVEKIQGKINVSSNSIISSGTTVSGASVVSVNQITDGLHFKINQKNHGMYSQNNFVKISGIESDIKPTIITSDYSPTSTSNISILSSSNFSTFENVGVASTNPGYILINSEIIQYTGINGNQLTGITRGVDNTIPNLHKSNDQVFKYEFNGVSLRRINKVHNMLDTDNISYPSTIDSYYLKLNHLSNGVNRSVGNNSNPELYFKEDKMGGSYRSSLPSSSSASFKSPKASKNILFNIIRPIVQTILPTTTSVNAKLRTVSGTSVDGNEISFIDKGFENISLLSNNILSDSRMICSSENEYNRLTTLPGKKSLTLEILLSTNDSRVSPMIDLDRVSVITVMNRIDTPVVDFVSNPLVNKLNQDPNSAIYISKIVKLEKSAESLKVIFDAYRHQSNEIRVMYRLFRNDTPDENQLFEFFPGYDNLNSDGTIIDAAKNSGLPDKYVEPSNREIDFNTYQFTAVNLPLFNGYQIKIIMTGTDQAKVPLIRDFRSIAII